MQDTKKTQGVHDTIRTTDAQRIEKAPDKRNAQNTPKMREAQYMHSGLGESACFVVGAGEPFAMPFEHDPKDFIIAVDGGLAYLDQYGITANLVVGDFDSLTSPPPKNNHTIVLPREKDDTDMVAALREARNRGYQTFRIYGGTGGRLDHTLANIQLLADIANRGGQGFLFDRDTIITAFRDSSVLFPETARGVVSVFSHTEVAGGVNERGLKYLLTDATLYNTDPVGISNEFTGAGSSISVRSGTLIIIYPREVGIVKCQEHQRSSL